MTIAPARSATLKTIDDKTLSGEPVSINGGVLTLAPAATTQAAITQAATTRAATQPSTPTSLTVPLTDIAQLVLQAPPAKPVVAPAVENAKSSGASAPPPTLLGVLVNSIFGTPTPTPGGAGGATPAPAPSPAEESPDQHPTTRPAGQLRWAATLTNGDLLHGRIEAWDNGTVSFRPRSAVRTLLAIPAEQVSALWLVGPADQAKARALIQGASDAEDVAFVRKDANTIVPVRGIALGIDGDALQFRYDDRDRRIALSKLLGLVMGSRHSPKPAVTFHFVVTLIDGDTISCNWTGIRRNWLEFETGWGQRFAVFKSHVTRLNAVGGRVVYVSDLQPVRVEQVPFFGRLVPYRLDRALSGGPITLADGPHDRGVATHARCVLEYELAGGFDRFRTTVGFEPDARDGAAAVRVQADGRTLYDEEDARGDRPPVPLDLDMTGVRRLTLVVDFGPEQDVQARVDWADARLLRPLALSSPPPSSSQPTTAPTPADEVEP